MTKLHYKDQPTEDEKRYFGPFLAEDEELILATGLGSTYMKTVFIFAFAWPGFIFLFASIGAAYFFHFDPMLGYGVGVMLALLTAIVKTHITYNANRYLLTTRRVLVKKGVLAVKLTAALYDKITHIEVNQSFFDKILMHHGTIIVNTAGASNDQIILTFVDYPIEFKNLLERLINREREQFGLRSSPLVTVEGEVVE